MEKLVKIVPKSGQNGEKVKKSILQLLANRGCNTPCSGIIPMGPPMLNVSFCISPARFVRNVGFSAQTTPVCRAGVAKMGKRGWGGGSLANAMSE